MVKSIHFPRYSFAQLLAALKLRWQELAQTNASPKSVAMAFAIGTFISVLPTPGLNLIIATFLASWFKQLNRAGLLAAIAVWNTLVVAPLYFISHKIGAFVFDAAPFTALTHNVDGVAVDFIIGNLLLAVSITAVSYLGVQIAISRYQLRAQPAR